MAWYEKNFSFEKLYGVPNGVLIGIDIGSGQRLVLLKLTQGPLMLISFTGEDA